MKFSYLQAMIPGWNIVYGIRLYQEFKKEDTLRQASLSETQKRCQFDLELAKNYASQRDAAKEIGDLVLASEFDQKIIDLAKSYIDRI